MDTMELGDVRGRKLKNIEEILIKEFSKLFDDKIFFKPKFETHLQEINVGMGNRENLETDRIIIYIKFGGYYFNLVWEGNPLNKQVPQKFLTKWQKGDKGPSDGDTHQVLNQAIWQLDQWIKQT
jgi:hypothetical protein